ncbi:hypothetical protein BC629DRAFT_1083283 [Irpex lacteus]|nr:hypothetical protein BC629DRAFT_1083283 [Irpex lacteus]
MSIPSVLSSPFVDRVEKLSSNKLSSLRSPGSDVRSSSSSQAPPPSTPPPNLQAPVPQRAAGGEITRLRLQQAAEQAALLQETESRRPEYLKRLKRPSPEVEEDVIVADQENTAPGLGLGVVDSPVKGRRIALFQETSEESFEQSLLAGGYPSYGLTPAYGEPSTPQHTSKSTLSQRAFDWLQQATPGQPPHPSTPGMNMKEDSEVVETEQESRKRRRLNAFRDYNAPPNDVLPKLYVVEVEGHGRVLIDHAPENLPLQHTTETPTKKRGNGRRKRGGGVQDSASHLSPSRKRPNLSLLDSYNDTVEAGRPNWLDQAFPWSMRLHEREELAHREEELKLKWVERYLERDSDEGEDNEDQSLGLPVEDFVEPPPRGGRGKMVPLPAYPSNSIVNLRQSPSKRDDKVYYPSDPADARAALLSKRSVRALAYRRMREEEAVCVCRGKDDGRELVQCDDCKEWFHLECIGVTDISDLGREEDPWYCRRCLGIPPARSSSPIFAPTDDRPATRPVRDPLFYQGNSQESPSTLPWHVPRLPKTPSRTLDVPQLSSRGSWDDSSSPVGPQTPSMSHRNVRSYTYETPKATDDFFDPLATPSRGMHFSGPFTTPRPSAFWATRASALQTPSRPTKRPPAPWAFDAPRSEDPFGSSPSRPSYAYDDSPVRRSQPRPEKHAAAARRVPESPSPLLGMGKHAVAVDRTHSQNALG